MKKSMIGLAILGSPGDVTHLILSANATGRIARRSASDDGNEVKYELVPADEIAQATEYELSPSDRPSTSITIAVPNTELFLVVEDVRMTELAATAITATDAALYANGQFGNTGANEIYSPTPANVFDRITLRGQDGKQVKGIELESIGANIRITAATAYANADHTEPTIALAAINSTQVYQLDPGTLEANVAFELASPVVRAARKDVDGSIAFKLEDGRIAKVNVNNGELQLAGYGLAPTDELAPEAQKWQLIGLSHAALDADGAPTNAAVLPTDTGVTYRFTPKAIEDGAQA